MVTLTETVKKQPSAKNGFRLNESALPDVKIHLPPPKPRILLTKPYPAATKI